MMKHVYLPKISLLYIILLLLPSLGVQAQTTEVQYLSGTGLRNTVTWDFRCSAGRNSGKWQKIEVPSQWELQGFGEYTYGRWYKEKGVKNPSMEEGIYRRSFKVPRAWQGRSIRLWFDGVMTDTDVLINGVSAGDTHRGGFYRFSYDVTSLLKCGATNRIEVRVKKHSDNKSVNAAERKADWWLFGGIYRPVWLEAKPETHIERLAVDARADGTLRAEVYLQHATGRESVRMEVTPLKNNITPVATAPCPPVRMPSSTGSSSQTLLLENHWDSIRAWTPESPHLYTLTVSLLDESGQTIHQTNTRIGFRTVEFRQRDGIYLNGTKLVMKGINRHSFHPDGGRTTNKEISVQDALLIKEMNMNAVRSHYPPDTHFLDACDSLSLLYVDELAGWQNAYDTPTGEKLVKEMITRSVNHPCIVLWSNGNEGGWNIALDSLFRVYDPQRRHVIHPWADFDELDTHHYPAYLTGVGRFTNGHKVFMPTEFMHGQYDQGHGAGLEDFWTRYTAHPLFAGGFLWAYSDEAVRRADRNGALDSERFNAPDGIVGPYREKEGSFYAVREIWSPVQVAPLLITSSFKGEFLVSNKYLFTNLRDCSMRYRVYRCPSPLSPPSPLQDGAEVCLLDSGLVKLPPLQPGETGYARIMLPTDFFEGDILELEAFGRDGQSLCTRTYPIRSAAEYAKNYAITNREQAKRTETSASETSIAASASVIEEDSLTASASITEKDSLVTLHTSALSISFRRTDATIAAILRHADGQLVPFTDGPLPVGMKMQLISLQVQIDQGDAVLCARYRGGVDSIVWRLHPDGLLSMNAVLLNRASGGGGFDDAFTDEEILNFGFTFSYPEAACAGMRWMGRGPYRVWKNRIPGTNYGIWEKAYNNTITGESPSPQTAGGSAITKSPSPQIAERRDARKKLLPPATDVTDASAATVRVGSGLEYPEFKGYHANLYWATLQSATAPFTVYSATDGVFLRLFTPEEPHGRQDGINTMPYFPAGDISFLLDIPGIRCFKPISQHGPQSQPGIIRIKKGDEGLRLGLVFDFTNPSLPRISPSLPLTGGKGNRIKKKYLAEFRKCNPSPP